MYTKYEIKSYPNNNSDVEQSKNYFHYKSKDYTNSETSDNNLETTFQPKCIFTKQNDNISFYQSTSKCDFKNSKKREENKTQNITPIIKDKNKIYTIQNTKERKDHEIQNFSYNYSDISENKNKNRNRTIKNNINNINININPNTNNYNFNTNSECGDDKEKTRRINLNEHILKKNKKKRITKSCKRQFNVQKRDNFNVLSYKQPEYDSDMNNTNLNKNKIIQIYKKQGVEEIFFPSKRTHSPTIPTKRKEIVEKYQSNTLKYQSFFGSFNSSNSNQQKMVKSYSRTKINQLNDFNIDKLIEIGDKYVNMMKPPLPLGKILNNSIINFKSKIKKNKFQIPINTNNNCFNFSKYSKRTFNKQLEDNKENIPLFIGDKSRVTKKLISKNNIKNQKLSITDKETEEKYPNENTVRKILNFKNDKKNDININTTTNSSVVIRRRRNNDNNVLFRKQNSYDKNIINDLGEEIPKRKVQKIVGDLRVNTNNTITPKYIILNKSKRKIENKKEKIMTEVNNYRTNRNNNEEKKGQNNNRKILIDINVSKKYNKYKNNKRQNQQYYGYDDRHNLEDTINNHSYYESLHSNKNLNNNVYEKVV